MGKLEQQSILLKSITRSQSTPWVIANIAEMVELSPLLSGTYEVDSWTIAIQFADWLK